MIRRYMVLCGTLLALSFVPGAQAYPARPAAPAIDKTQLPSNYVPTGAEMYKQYCAACHGPAGKGDGPFASLLKMPPANLATLSKRHGGMFPYEYVAGVLRFGTGPTMIHGSSDMPTWGPLFQYVDKNNQKVVQQRIKNLSDYLATIQEK